MPAFKLHNRWGNWECDANRMLDFCRLDFCEFWDLPIDGNREVMLHVTILPANRDWRYKVTMVPHHTKNYKQAEIRDRDDLLVATKTLYSWTDDEIMALSLGTGIVYIWITKVR